MDTCNINAIGASSGGFVALQGLVADLPPDLSAALFVVWGGSKQASRRAGVHLGGRLRDWRGSPQCGGDFRFCHATARHSLRIWFHEIVLAVRSME